MNPLKIGIVEDDLLIAESIILTLHQIGYTTSTPARSFLEALKMIKNEAPDLLLIDIKLEGDKDGIDLANAVNKEFGIPFIFLTANSDPATVSRAKTVNPYAFLVKPFNEHDLFSSIEIAFNNYNLEQKAIEPDVASIAYLKDVIFIKEGDLYHKLEVNDILYMESDNIYISIHTDKRYYVVRGKLDDFVSTLKKGVFFRVHRSYVINLKHLETINSLKVKVGGKEVPLHKNYKQELLKMVSLIK